MLSSNRERPRKTDQPLTMNPQTNMNGQVSAAQENGLVAKPWIKNSRYCSLLQADYLDYTCITEKKQQQGFLSMPGTTTTTTTMWCPLCAVQQNAELLLLRSIFFGRDNF